MDEQVSMPHVVTHEVVRDERWTFLTKFLFRVFALFTFLLLFPFPLSILPIISGLLSFVDELWYPLIQWVGDNVLQLPYPITVLPNGSGDTTYNYVQIFIIGSISIIGAIFWSVFDYKRASYKQLYKWFYYFVAVYLGAVMIAYGVVKIIKLQFPSPSFSLLLQPIGELSPMGLAWAFLGHSSAYNMFMGIAEVSGGLFLLWRRTQFVGSIIASLVMINVLMMNFCYDIPVKLFSSELLLFALFIFGKDGYRLIRDLFAVDKGIGKLYHVDEKKKWKVNIVRALIILLPLIIIAENFISVITMAAEQREEPAPHFYGVYDVKSYINLSDSAQTKKYENEWSQIIVDKFDMTRVRFNNGQDIWYRQVIDTNEKSFRLMKVDSDKYEYKFNYISFSRDSILLFGTVREDSVAVTLISSDTSSLRLINRGFHWINEYPYNR